jgi:hypothetical protein
MPSPHDNKISNSSKSKLTTKLVVFEHKETTKLHKLLIHDTPIVTCCNGNDEGYLN